MEAFHELPAPAEVTIKASSPATARTSTSTAEAATRPGRHQGTAEIAPPHGRSSWARR